MYIKGSLKMIKLMVMENIQNATVKCMKDIGNKTCLMAERSKCLILDQNIMEISKMEQKMGMVFMFGQTMKNMKVIGTLINYKVKVHFITRMALLILEHGETIKNMGMVH